MWRKRTAPAARPGSTPWRRARGWAPRSRWRTTTRPRRTPPRRRAPPAVPRARPPAGTGAGAPAGRPGPGAPCGGPRRSPPAGPRRGDRAGRHPRRRHGRSTSAWRSAAARPTAPATSWVPLRRSRSCPPPYWRRQERQPRADARAPRPDRAPDLVRAEGHEVHAGGELGQVEEGCGLDGVGEDAGLRGPPPHGLDDRGHRLDDAGLVVGRHDRHQGRAGGERAGHASRSSTPCASTGSSRASAPRAAAAQADSAHRRVLGGRAQHLRLAASTQRRLDHAEDGEVVRLGAARGEDDLPGVTPGNTATSSTASSRSRRARWAGDGFRGVPERGGMDLVHGGTRLGPQRRRGRVVQVGHDGVRRRRRSWRWRTP